MYIYDTLRDLIVYCCRYLLAFLRGHKLMFRDVYLDRAQASSNVIKEFPKLSGRLAVITGGTRGIGYETLRMLLQCDMHVLLACRNLSGGEKAIESIRESGVTGGRAEAVKLDNSSLESVRKFAERFRAKYDKLDLLVCNAGIFCTPYEETPDGFESQYAVNYLSHFLLTLLLIPSLKAASIGKEPPARIVMVSSSAHEMGRIHWEDFNQKKNYVSLINYAQSKLAQVMLTKKLARYFKKEGLNICVNSCHPGIVDTEIFLNTDNYVRHLAPLGKFFCKNPRQGAVCVAHVAVSPEVRGVTGRYYYNCLERAPSAGVDDETAQDRLFEISLKQAGVDNFRSSSRVVM